MEESEIDKLLADFKVKVDSMVQAKVLELKNDMSHIFQDLEKDIDKASLEEHSNNTSQQSCSSRSSKKKNKNKKAQARADDLEPTEANIQQALALAMKLRDESLQQNQQAEEEIPYDLPDVRADLRAFENEIGLIRHVSDSNEVPEPESGALASSAETEMDKQAVGSVNKDQASNKSGKEF